MNRYFISLAAALIAFPALALDLQTARNQGIIGEKTDGYVAVVTPSADAQKLAAEVNARRKEEYARISKANGQPVEVVAKVAAESIISKLPAGSLYQDASGAWKKR
ncbi:MAG: YdbL family protein [Alphaproteobacteria bacterium]|nr:YdbL family protein [Alphaproteobacteria bacterium]